MADNHRLLRPKTGIEIPLHSVRKYVPGSGPPPPRISLAPPRDSTAYIIDQFVLPPDKDMTETSRKMIYYHIGFTDLPAVKILVPCDKVLDYVSPRELEDWEFKNMESKEEERALLMESVGASVLSPADETLLLAEEVAGPSLSTPKKRRPVVEVLDSEDMGETSNGESDDAAINRQLQADAGAEDLGLVENLEMDSESVDQLSLEYDTLASDASAGKRKRHSTGGTKPALEKPQKKSNKKQKVIPEPEPAADEWEVKDLLDDQWVVENGDKIQKYLVLWAGDWPPDQNPTWEPADNIQDQALVQRYQKKKRTGLLKTPKTTQKTLHRCLAGRQ
ncbi:hypothetical protein N0V88_004336 [Collariella sp. IMI 366227]|nr:hypothetical protein N0V88_004336 [Collariella sp. IMI 366227]